jgi:hypothetical protein
MDEQQQRRRQRDRALQLLDDHIGEHLRDSQKSGELQSAPSWGKPQTFSDGYDQTPAELRMGMKILKDAGIVPPEVEMMNAAAALEAEIAACADEARRRALQQQLADKRQAIALRLEALARTRSL